MTVQADHAVAPVLATVMFAVKPPPHSLALAYVTWHAPAGALDEEDDEGVVGVVEGVVLGVVLGVELGIELGDEDEDEVPDPVMVPYTIPRPFVPTYTRPYTRGSPVIAAPMLPHWCWSSLIRVHVLP